MSIRPRSSRGRDLGRSARIPFAFGGRRAHPELPDSACDPAVVEDSATCTAGRMVRSARQAFDRHPDLTTQAHRAVDGCRANASRPCRSSTPSAGPSDGRSPASGPLAGGSPSPPVTPCHSGALCGGDAEENEVIFSIPAQRPFLSGLSEWSGIPASYGPFRGCRVSGDSRQRVVGEPCLWEHPGDSSPWGCFWGLLGVVLGVVSGVVSGSFGVFRGLSGVFRGFVRLRGLSDKGRVPVLQPTAP